MKITHYVISVLMCATVLALSGCENTLHGMHQDWRQGTQEVANATGN